MSRWNELSRRAVLAGLLALPGAAYAEAPPNSFPPRRRGDGGRVSARPGDAGALIEAAKLGGSLGYAVADAATGEVLESVGAALGQPPASTAKVITSLYGLTMLGAKHRFVTRVLATGPVSGGKIEGDLVLAGTGDPELQTDMLGDLVARLGALGVREVTGRFLVCDGALPYIPEIDAEQPEFVGYNPSISGMNLNFNRVHFEWKLEGAEYSVAMDARGERFIPPVSMARMAVADRTGPLFTYAGGSGQESWTVARKALGEGGSRWLPVRHPGHYAGEVFRTLARAQGIILPLAVVQKVVPDGRELVRFDSGGLDGVLKDMLRFSTNLTAEVVGLTASGATSLAGSGRAMSDWLSARHGVQADFADHSGLSGRSRISAAGMVRALVAARNDLGSGAVLPLLLKNFGMRDSKGNPIKGHKVLVPAKTGTLNFVSALVGYVVPPTGRDLAFSIFAADLPQRARLAEAEREDPPGGEAWGRRARRLQGALIDRWVGLYV